MKIGLLIDGPLVDSYIAAAMKEVLDETDAEVTLIVENADDSWVGQYIETALSDRIWSIHHAIRLVARRIRGYQAFRKPTDLRTIIDFDETEHIVCHPELANGFGKTLPADVVETARSVDVLFRFGFGFLKGDILDAPTHGTLSYHHGDFRRYRGRPPGFWEFIHDEETAGVTLQRLNETLDGGEIIVERQVQISGCDTWQEVKHRLYTVSKPMLAEGVRRLSEEDFNAKEVTDLGPVYTRPTTPDFMRYLWKNTKGRLRRD
jgi:hypothetical protein